LGKTLGRLHKCSSEYNNVKKESCFEIFEEEFKLFPMFRRFDNLRQYINLKDVVEETWDNEPEWMVNLRETLNNIIMEIGNNFNYGGNV